MTVAITGGANGIGAAMVRAFHQRKAHVFFCDLDEAAGRALADEIGSAVRFERLDLRSEPAINRWIARIVAQSRTIDVLINNAAADPRAALQDTSAEVWDDILARNLRAYFLTIRAAQKYLSKGASIINFSSITFHLAPKDMSAYVTSKAGIIGLTRALARELGPRGIRVNTLSPGWVMTKRQLRHLVTPAVKRMLRRSQCIPELLQPEEIAQVALFLASPASAAITGQEILADRGWAHH